jgi:hypothetical protein
VDAAEFADNVEDLPEAVQVGEEDDKLTSITQVKPT